MTTPSYVTLMMTLALNSAVLGCEQLQLEDILKARGYTNPFCGLLISHAYVFGTIFMLIAAAWIDNSTNYVKVSRIACVLCVFSYTTFNISIILPNIKNIIIITNIMTSFGASLMYPALMQVSIRCARGILPEATVSAITVIMQQLLTCGLVNLLDPLRNLIKGYPDYESKLIIHSKNLARNGNFKTISNSAFFLPCSPDDILPPCDSTYEYDLCGLLHSAKQTEFTEASLRF